MPATRQVHGGSEPPGLPAAAARRRFGGPGQIRQPAVALTVTANASAAPAAEDGHSSLSILSGSGPEQHGHRTPAPGPRRWTNLNRGRGAAAGRTGPRPARQLPERLSRTRIQLEWSESR